MSETLRYTSINETIAKVIADNDLEDHEVKVSDFVTWAGEAIKKIGAMPMFRNRITGIEDKFGFVPILTITDYRTEYPCDAYSIYAVGVGSSPGGSFHPARLNTGLHNKVSGVSASTTSDIDEYPALIEDKIQFVADVFNESYSDAYARINSTPALDTILSNVFINTTSFTTTEPLVDYDYTYEPNPPYIDFNIKTGYAVMIYKAVVTDGDGYPMIPDTEEVKEAVYWYITMKYTYPLWRKGKVRDIVYDEAKFNWKTWRLNAYGSQMMPKGAGAMQSFMNVWMRLVPKMNEFSTYLNYTGTQEVIYNR